jgi:CubicO group peptidase (beta-lactamase class C family)
MRPLDLSCYAGASVFLSTPSDLVRFGAAINSGKLLQPVTVRELQAPLRLTTGEPTSYGLGWEREDVTLGSAQTQSIGHDGHLLGGQVASLRTFPDQQLAVAVVSNVSYANAANVSLQIAQAFSGE